MNAFPKPIDRDTVFKILPELELRRSEGTLRPGDYAVARDAGFSPQFERRFRRDYPEVEYPLSKAIEADAPVTSIRRRAATLAWTVIPFAVGIGFGGGYALATFY